MNNDTIVEGNKLIDAFAPEVSKEQRMEYLATIRDNIELKYHSSWDWLMPVVEKIENGARVDIYGKACKISQIQWDIDIAHINEHKITAVWLCVVDFIQWYNTQTKPHQ